jgi:hypothetical protein
MNKELLCKDCAHAILPAWHRRWLYSVRFADCKKSYVEPRFNPVDGTSSPGYYAPASVVRVDRTICGPDAKSWMPRTKYDLFKLIKHSEQ